MTIYPRAIAALASDLLRAAADGLGLGVRALDRVSIELHIWSQS